ncbi:preprotein translocase subunit SecG [Aureimonas jatrophae]|uniref:preprotein translocase subunit SecG n=1 Tax=Aureimonas jatrophae TaxID=1166073 RepID=UPI000AD5D1BF|nr:preprotein translocase subunit SecG [Aureimonas jatrophae]MBB3949853.1 preprotein translocase subunit SecG [Aureimonas jatrophae]
MQTVLIVIHLLIVLALVVVVLLQRSEGGALGMGGGGGGLMTARGAANVLTRTTAILATLFFITSMALGILARYGGDNPLDILDRIPAQQNGAAPAGADQGNLLDQLGPLPDATPATPQVPTGTGGTQPSVAPSTPVAPPVSTGVPTGAAAPNGSSSNVIPANPAPEASNSNDVPTVPPVEAPAAGTTTTGPTNP